MQLDDLISVLYALDPKQIECPQIYVNRGIGTKPSLVEPVLLRFFRKDELQDLIMRVVCFRGDIEGEKESFFSLESYSGTRVRPISVYVKIRHLLVKSEYQEDGSMDWPHLSDELLNQFQHPKNGKN